MASPYKWLRITDGTTDSSGHRREVNLLSGLSGFCMTEWDPATAEPKGGGVWSDSALSAGRRLHIAKPANVVETMTLGIRNFNADTLIRDTRTLRQLLESAREYWTSNWTTTPVWVEAQGVNETNRRYALISDYRTPRDSDPYHQPFWQTVERAGMDDFDLVFEREPYWRDNVPGESDCLEIGTTQAWCPVYPLEFNGTTSIVNIGNPVKNRNLPAGDFTLDGWIRADGWGEGNAGVIYHKTSVYFSIGAASGLIASAIFNGGGQPALSTSGPAIFSPDGEWHHVAAIFDTVTGFIDLYIDGIEIASYVSHQPAMGAYAGDAGANAAIGNNIATTSTWDGGIGWFRISNNERWTAAFDPPERCILPNSDANTIWLGIHEGTPEPPGVGDIHDMSGMAVVTDGDATDCTWGDCCEVYFGNYLPGPKPYMISNRSTSVVDCGAGANLLDLPDTEITVEAWVWLRSYTGTAGDTEAFIAEKTDWIQNGWYFQTDTNAGLIFCIYVGAMAGTENESHATAGQLSLFEWHHVAATFNDAAVSRVSRLWIDGREVVYSLQEDAGANPYRSDAGISLELICITATVGYALDGYIQWCRVSSTVRYTDTFDPPERCKLPAPDASTEGLWQYTTAELISDFSGNGNDGDPLDVLSGYDCPLVEETCDADTVYVANKHNIAQLTHVFYDDAGAFSPNLLAQPLPYALLPAAPVAGDAFYAGIDSLIPDSGPFCSIVFDLATAQTGLTFSYTGSTFWQYWNGGAWTWLNEQDNTNNDGLSDQEPFDTVGVKSLHWSQPQDWSLSVVNGVDAYWVRCVVGNIAPGTTPVQQERNVYSVLWPYVEIQEDKVGGDVPPLIRQYIRNQSDKAGAVRYSDRVLIGLRSLSRGENFTAYLNCSPEQNVTGITADDAGFGNVFVADMTTPTGWCLQCTAPVIGGEDVVTFIISASLANEYIGAYHVFLRGHQTTAGTIEAELQGYVGLTDNVVLSDRVAFATLSDWEVLDLGPLTIPFYGSPLPSEMNDIYLTIYLYGDGANCDLYDLILLPVDEWAIDTGNLNVTSWPSTAAKLGYRNQPTSGGPTPIGNTYLDVDSIANPKVPIRSTLKYYYTDLMATTYSAITPEPMIAQRGEAQRYWFLHTTLDTRSTGIGSQPEIVNSVQNWNVQRYISMRGDS